MCAAKVCNLSNGQKKSATPIGVAQEDAAAMFGVGVRAVQRALDVLRNGCVELVRQCELGEVSVSLGSQFVEVEDDKKQQAAIAKQGKQAIRDYITPNDEVEQEPEPDEPKKPSAFVAFRKLWETSDDLGRAAIRAFILESA